MTSMSDEDIKLLAECLRALFLKLNEDMGPRQYYWPYRNFKGEQALEQAVFTAP